MEFFELIDRVATKGGITEEGVKVLNRHLPAVFDEVFEKTLAKHETVKEMVKNQNLAQVVPANPYEAPACQGATETLRASKAR
jgi:pyrroline-5-carboxylate reductase